MDNIDAAAVKELERRIQVLTRRMRRQFIRAMTDGKFMNYVADWSLDDINEYYCLNLLPYYAYNVLVLRAIPKQTETESRLDQVMSEVEAQLRIRFGTLFHECEMETERGQLVCMFNITTHRDSPETEAFKLEISRVFAQISTRPDYRDFAFVMGEGVPVSDVRDLNQCFHSALHAAKYGIVSGLNKKYDSNELVHTIGDIMAVLTPARKGALRSCIETLNYDELQKQILELLHGIRDFLGQYPCLASQLPQAILDTCVSCVQERMEQDCALPEAKAVRQQLDRCLTVADAERVCLEQIPAFLTNYEHLFISRDKQPIAAAKRFIRANFSRELSLTKVAGHVSLNHQYFSVLFKRETGTAVIDYITQVRVEQAKLLLRGTHKTIQEIAWEVGFQDPRYFSRQFKKQAGMTPRAYRDQIRLRDRKEAEPWKN